ncbi:MAG: ROK family protein, partial [Lachnospiraceae bacterium]|nr:ROK family protein [Lachnospiraceae bacterium]
MKNYVFGVDIGGTTVKLGLFDTQGNVLDKWEIPTRTEDNGSHILPDIAESIREKMKLIDRDSIAGVGVGAPG